MVDPRKISDYRRLQRMSQAELGRKIHRSQSWVARFEAGNATATPRDIRRIGRALGLNLHGVQG